MRNCSFLPLSATRPSLRPLQAPLQPHFLLPLFQHSSPLKPPQRPAAALCEGRCGGSASLSQPPTHKSAQAHRLCAFNHIANLPYRLIQPEQGSAISAFGHRGSATQPSNFCGPSRTQPHSQPAPSAFGPALRSELSAHVP